MGDPGHGRADATSTRPRATSSPARPTPRCCCTKARPTATGLLGLVREHGLQATVTLDAHYRDNAALAELVSAADVVLLPYDSTDQVTSGVLIEAMAAAKPVVATRFPHAVELLGNGAGLLVPQQDPAAMAAALRTVLTRRDVAAGMTQGGAVGRGPAALAGGRRAGTTTWPAG